MLNSGAFSLPFATYPIDSDDIIHLAGHVCQATRIQLIKSGNGGVQQGSENELFY